MFPVETARCVDCYTVSFADEMKRCSLGHLTCPGCICDCEFLAGHDLEIPSWLRHDEGALYSGSQATKVLEG